eukprot:1138677-Pelagomonas_calceolata.AAC.4
MCFVDVADQCCAVWSFRASCWAGPTEHALVQLSTCVSDQSMLYIALVVVELSNEICHKLWS